MLIPDRLPGALTVVAFRQDLASDCQLLSQEEM